MDLSKLYALARGRDSFKEVEAEYVEKEVK